LAKAADAARTVATGCAGPAARGAVVDVDDVDGGGDVAVVDTGLAADRLAVVVVVAVAALCCGGLVVDVGAAVMLVVVVGGGSGPLRGAVVLEVGFFPATVVVVVGPGRVVVVVDVDPPSPRCWRVSWTTTVASVLAA